MAEKPIRMKDRLLFVFTDKFMALWLVLTTTGIIVFRFHPVIGVLLCLPAMIFFGSVFVYLAIANRKQAETERKGREQGGEGGKE